MFRLATKIGVVAPCYNASSLTPLPSSMDLQSLGLEGVLDNNMANLKDNDGKWKKAPLRTHARAVSRFGGQGMMRCDCTGKCDTKRCSCFKAGRECNSRCHNKNTCCVNQQCQQ